METTRARESILGIRSEIKTGAWQTLSIMANFNYGRYSKKK